MNGLSASAQHPLPNRRASNRRWDAKASEVLSLAAKDWSDLDGAEFPAPRSIDALRADPQFRDEAADAVVAAVPFSGAGRSGCLAVAATRPPLR